MSETQISDAEAERCLTQANATARKHTDVVIRVPKDGGSAGLASCLHLDVEGRHVIVTCNHVLREEHAYFTGPPRTKGLTIDESETGHQVTSLTLISSDKDLDLAVFESKELDLSKIGKQVYPLSESDWFSEERLAPDGTASFIYGVWGEKSKCFQYPDGLVSLDAPIYSGLGPITECSSKRLIADMAEVKALWKADRFADVKPTGGQRDLEGISGSGLWMILDNRVRVVGVVLGRKTASADKHLIRVTPVWQLSEWLKKVLG